MTQTPTDPIRDEAVKVLAEALHEARIGCSPFAGTVMVSPSGASTLERVAMPPCGPIYHRHDGEHLLDASPTLARRLAFGTAWDAAVAALPPRWELVLRQMQDDHPMAEAWDPHYPALHEPAQPRYYEDADSPELALAALAAKLGSGK